MGYGCPNCQHEIEDAIPKSRLDKEIDKRRDLEQRATAAESALKAAQSEAKLAAKHQARAEELEAALADTRLGHEVELSMVSHGVDDPDIRDAFASAWKGLEGEDRPAFGEWFSGIVEDPTSAPKLLQPWVPGAKGQEAPEAPKGPARVQASAGTRTGTPQDAPASWTPQDFRDPETGRLDVQKYKANRDAVLQQVGRQGPKLPGG